MYSYREEKGSDSSDSSGDENDIVKRIQPPKSIEESKESLPNVSVQSMEDDGAPKRPKRKINPVWATVMSENILSEDLGQFELKLKRFESDRSVENYDYNWKKRYLAGKQDAAKIFSGGNNVEGRRGEKEKSRNRSRSREGTGEKKMVFSVEKEEAFKVARIIAAKLEEPNQKLIYRTVRVLGTKVALETTNSVEEIEKNGGMKVLDGSRRRTPGGIYLYLLKSNPNIERHFKDYIFNEQYADQRIKLNKSMKKMHKKQKSKRKSRKNSKQMDQSEETDVKPLPTKLELLVSNENSEESLPASEEREGSSSSSTTSRSSSCASEHKEEETKVMTSGGGEIKNEEIEDGEILD